MTVFKGFLKIVKRNSAIAIIYLGIFIVITMATSSSLKRMAKDTYEISKPNILFIAEGEQTELKEKLFEMLEHSANLHIVSDVLKAKDDIVSQKADCLLVIGDDALDRMKNGRPAVDVFYELGNPAGILADADIDKLLRYMDASLRTYGTIDYAGIEKALEESIAVEIEPKDVENLSKTEFFKQYMKFFHYIFLSISLFIISPILLQISKGSLRTRCSVSSLRPAEYFLQLALAVTVLTTLFIILFVLFGLAVVEFQVKSGTVLLLVSDIFVFGLTLMSFVVLISSLPVSVRFISAFANIFSIVVAFTAGIFVPTEFLPEAVINFSKFFPAYYSVRLTTAEQLSAGEVAYHFGIQLLFALVFSLGAIYLNKSRRRSAINVSTT